MWGTWGTYMTQQLLHHAIQLNLAVPRKTKWLPYSDNYTMRLKAHEKMTNEGRKAAELTKPTDGFHKSAGKHESVRLGCCFAPARSGHATYMYRTAESSISYGDLGRGMPLLLQFTLQKWRILPARSAFGSCCFIEAR